MGNLITTFDKTSIDPISTYRTNAGDKTRIFTERISNSASIPDPPFTTTESSMFFLQTYVAGANIPLFQIATGVNGQIRRRFTIGTGSSENWSTWSDLKGDKGDTGTCIASSNLKTNVLSLDASYNKLLSFARSKSPNFYLMVDARDVTIENNNQIIGVNLNNGILNNRDVTISTVRPTREYDEINDVYFMNFDNRLVPALEIYNRTQFINIPIMTVPVNWTFTFIISFRSFSNTGSIFISGGNSTGLNTSWRRIFWSTTGGNLQGISWDSANASEYPKFSPTFETGKWYQIAVTQNANNPSGFDGYLDGVRVFENITLSNRFGFQGQIQLGMGPYGNERQQTAISFIQLYTRNLPPSDIATIYNLSLNKSLISNDDTTNATVIQGMKTKNLLDGEVLVRDNLTINKKLNVNNNLCIGLTCISEADLIDLKEKNFDRIGAIIPFAGNNIPDGYLLCDGSAVSRTTFRNLFNVIGSTYGGGDGSTTFNIPDLRGRTIVGAGQGANLTNRTLNAVGGAETVTLTVNELPAHNHEGSTSTNGNHTHNWGANIGYSTGDNAVWGANNAGFKWYASGQTDGYGNHSHTFTTNNRGNGQSHENMPPFRVLNYIIKF